MGSFAKVRFFTPPELIDLSLLLAPFEPHKSARAGLRGGKSTKQTWKEGDSPTAILCSICLQVFGSHFMSKPSCKSLEDFKVLFSWDSNAEYWQGRPRQEQPRPSVTMRLVSCMVDLLRGLEDK